MRPILLLDFGSQFAHLIANRIRRIGAYSDIVPISISAQEIADRNPAGIILSGGPQSVFSPESPQPDAGIFDLGIPLFGICYGHQLLAQHFGGEIRSGEKEFGEAIFSHTSSSLFQNIPKESTVWMNHGDSVFSLPEGFETTGETKDCSIAAFEQKEKKIVSVQFHPEVTHSEYGMTILENFVDMCGTKGNWNTQMMLENTITEIQEHVGDRKVFLMVSGGVDSSVAFSLLNKALGEDRVYGLFVDTGLLRKNERESVKKMLAEAGFKNLHVAEESDRFLSALEGISDPEEKRKRIGDTFLEVQRDVSQSLKLDDGSWLLGQGTIYPDHIETGGSEHASKIKTHHNRVPEIEKLIVEEKIVEPLSEFYKDEVRALGRELGLSDAMVDRHPFPGPGLGVRILCQSQREKGDFSVFSQKIESAHSISATVLPIRSVGVQGDARSYRHPVAIFGNFSSHELLSLATKIPNTSSEINRVVWCLSHKEKQRYATQESSFMTLDRVTLLQEADFCITNILQKHDLVKSVWQFPVVLCPVGIDGQESIILRPIESENAMTARPVVFPPEILAEMSEELLKIKGISSVFLDVTSKPPGTIEWE